MKPTAADLLPIFMRVIAFVLFVGCVVYEVIL